jgi:murein DD-endopeptidase MepM/ murein hydrolase activator NlpD
MWPYRFELDPGETFTLPIPGGADCAIRLLGVEETTWADYFTRNPSRATYAGAEVRLEVDGQAVTLTHRPYQMPLQVGRARIYVETTYHWAHECEIEALRNVRKAVRLSALPAGVDWGPRDIVFPIADYRWRSAPYNNTWGALVPYNLLYYHRGEDYGAIPDRLEVRAARAGEVVFSPLSTPQSSNLLTIRSADGRAVSYCHMNSESIRPDLLAGMRVTAGEVLAKTGETWDGRRSQDWDPHLHVEFDDQGHGAQPGAGREDLYSAYPFLIQAYLRDYPDPVLAVAGGTHYGLPGQTIQLDASRSVAREGDPIQDYTWVLSDGRVVAGARVEMRYDKPGLYAEELRVRTARGEDRDYAHVRVYNPSGEAAVGCGFCYHTPVRGIRPGMDVLFWNRLQVNVSGAVTIDFSDGTAPRMIERECVHRFRRAGIYTSTLSARGVTGEPLTLKMRVVVD